MRRLFLFCAIMSLAAPVATQAQAQPQPQAQAQPQTKPEAQAQAQHLVAAGRCFTGACSARRAERFFRALGVWC